LRAHLGFWTCTAQSKNPADRLEAQQALQHWQSDVDLAGIRDPAALAKLPADERLSVAEKSGATRAPKTGPPSGATGTEKWNP
jgi:hypothetical protein